ncbi:MAG: hypothetical protein WAM58_18665 [Candidatus Acidiferrum sp.]
MKAREKKATQSASPSLLTGWARQGVQSFVSAQKILMDLAAQENALLIGMVREGFSKPGTRFGASVAGIAEKGVENLTTVGKILLDLAADETALALDGAKDVLRLPAAAGAVAEVARHRVGTIIEMQKNLLDATAEQAHSVAESYREDGKLQAAARVTELTRRGIQEFVDSEKKFLDLAMQEVTAATKNDKPAHKPPRDRVEVLTKVAREGAEKYFETQKKLMDFAIEQFEGTAKAGRERFKQVTRKEARPSLGELTEKSMKNFVNAEKSLLDLAMNPVGPGEKKDRKPSRRGHRMHHAAKKAAAEGKHVANVA